MKHAAFTLSLAALALAAPALTGCQAWRWLGRTVETLGTPPAPPPRSVPKSFRGHVFDVPAGDRFRVTTGDFKTVEVALAGIAPPPDAHPAALEARKKLAALVMNREVTVRPVRPNRGSARVASVTVGELNVNRAMVRAGLARVTPDADEKLRTAEQQARAARVGMWATR